MSTPRTHTIVSRISLVSRAAALTITLAVGACARNPSPTAATEMVPERFRTVRFENEAEVPVDVYLIGQQREWRLGRVAPGARGTLRLPTASLASTLGVVRLATIAGGAPSVAAARDPRAVFTIEQSTSSILSQRWTFAQRQAGSPVLFGMPAKTRRQ